MCLQGAGAGGAPVANSDLSIKVLAGAHSSWDEWRNTWCDIPDSDTTEFQLSGTNSSPSDEARGFRKPD